MTDLLKLGPIFGVDVNHVARLRLLVALHRRLGVQVPQSTDSECFHHTPQGGKGSPKELVDPPGGAALMPEAQNVLQLLWIKHPP